MSVSARVEDHAGPLDMSIVDRSAKFELILISRCQYWGWRYAGRLRGRSAKFELILTTRCHYWKGEDPCWQNRGVDLPNFELILDHYMSVLGRVDLVADLGVVLPNLNSSWPLDVSTWGGRPAKFELIFSTRCQYYGGVHLLADLGVDLSNLNSSLPLDSQYWGDSI